MTNASDDWVSTWAAMTVPPWERWTATGKGFHDQTLRQMVFTSAGGDAVRLRISNRHGKQALHIGMAAVGVARRPNGADLIPGTTRCLQFDGADAVKIPAGEEVTSDPVGFDVLSHQVIAIDLYLPEPTLAPEYSLNPIQAAYMASQNRVGSEDGAPFAESLTGSTMEGADILPNPLTSYIVGLDVRSSSTPGCVVIAGDSLTFGRWSHWLSRRVHSEFDESPPAIAHVATSGIKLSQDSISSPSFESRFTPDVLSITGISHVITSIGFNDLAVPSPAEFAKMLAGESVWGAPRTATAPDLIRAYESVINQAKDRGVRIFGCTIPPGNGGALRGGYHAAGKDGPTVMIELWPDANEQIRAEVNQWIREVAPFDGVVDIASLLENRMDRTVQDPCYSDDGVHLNAGGWFEMAYAVDLPKLLER